MPRESRRPKRSKHDRGSKQAKGATYARPREAKGERRNMDDLIAVSLCRGDAVTGVEGLSRETMFMRMYPPWVFSAFVTGDCGRGGWFRDKGNG